MGYHGTLRAIEAAERREQREALRRLRDAERHAKEQAKSSAMEQAAFQVAEYERRMSFLLSVHKECGEAWDWLGIVSSLPTPTPLKGFLHELNALQESLKSFHKLKHSAHQDIQAARALDEQHFRSLLSSHSVQLERQEKLRELGRRILANEHKAFIEALVAFSPLGALSELGSELHFTVHSKNFVECRIKVNGSAAIPAESKALTVAGKLSSKPIARAKFQEIYQDYICSCILRVARESFALLPIDLLLITAFADLQDSRTGHISEQPVLSVAFPRVALSQLNFDSIDPSDAVENFQHRGDFKASRKLGAFQPVAPLTIREINFSTVESIEMAELFNCVSKAAGELRIKAAMFEERLAELTLTDKPTL